MNDSKTINLNLRSRSRCWLLSALAVTMSLLQTQAGMAGQRYFDVPDEAADNLVIAVARNDVVALERLLGEDYRKLLPLDRISDEDKERFFQAWGNYHALMPADHEARLLLAGENGWTLPIPIVRETQGWRFDTAEGVRMMRVRRIGRNELDTLQSLLAYRDAQLEYATRDHDSDGVLEFAQRFISSPGQQDGLYWETQPGEPYSPLGPLFAGTTPQNAYHGYHYRMLMAQGNHAPGGAFDYLVDGNMVLGFAVIAWPVNYGESGVMSFMLSRDDSLYEADLGPDGDRTANTVTAYDPEGQWSPVPRMFTVLVDAPD